MEGIIAKLFLDVVVVFAAVTKQEYIHTLGRDNMKSSQWFIGMLRENSFHNITFTIVLIFLLLGVSQNSLALTKPALQLPGNNAQITTPSFTFSWSHPYNDKYEVKIKTSGGTLKYASGKISSKSIKVNLSSIPLAYGSTYKWYVVVYANGQETSSADGLFTYKFTEKPAVSAARDQQKPVVSGFDVKKVGETVTVSYKVTDLGGSGLKQVELWRSTNNRDWAEITNKRRPLSGNGPISGSFTDIPPSAGTYYYGVHVVDNAGNWNSEGGPKSVTVAKSSGQTSISGQNPFKNFVGQCTWWVCEKLIEHNWSKFPSIRSAKYWIIDAKNNGFKTGNTPIAGSIVVFIKYNVDPNKKGNDLLYNYGHVAYVESVNGNIYKVSESNYDGRLTRREIWSNDRNFFFNQYRAGFIYKP